MYGVGSYVDRAEPHGHKVPSKSLAVIHAYAPPIHNRAKINRTNPN
jgi:hypothetical protein